MRFRFGEIPHIQWWRLMNMTEGEIEDFNNKHLVEIEMSGITEDTKLSQQSIAVWNAAIEAAANKSESNGAISIAMEIRKLKK
jgi:hypothetical protein